MYGLLWGLISFQVLIQPHLDQLADVAGCPVLHQNYVLVIAIVGLDPGQNMRLENLIQVLPGSHPEPMGKMTGGILSPFEATITKTMTETCYFDVWVI